MANSDEVLALNALLGLTGQLLDHRSTVKGIKTEADLKREEMKMRVMEQQKANDLELKKHAISITLDEIKDLKQQKKASNKQLETMTGLQYDFSANERTKIFPEVVKNMNASNSARWDQLGEEYDQKRDRLQKDVDTIRRELGNIRPILNTIEQRVNPNLAGDQSKLDLDDYDAITKIAYQMEEIEDPTKYMRAAVENFKPGYNKLLQLNNMITQGEDRDKNQSIREGVVLMDASKYADSDVEQMMMLMLDSDTGSESPLLEDIKNKIDVASKKGEKAYDMSWDQGESPGQAVIEDISTALEGASMHSFENALKESPWIETIIKSEMPGVWDNYQRNRRYYKSIAESKPLKVNNKSNKKNTNSTYQEEIDSLFD